jgi:hypothetical protein
MRLALRVRLESSAISVDDPSTTRRQPVESPSRICATSALAVEIRRMSARRHRGAALHPLRRI